MRRIFFVGNVMIDTLLMLKKKAEICLKKYRFGGLFCGRFIEDSKTSSFQASKRIGLRDTVPGGSPGPAHIGSLQNLKLR